MWPCKAILFIILILPTKAAVRNVLKDDIPSPEFIEEALLFSKQLWRINSAESSTDWGRFEPIFFQETDSEAEVGIGSFGETIYIGFRSTDERDDWWYNLNVRKTNFEASEVPGLVHQGWYNKWFEDEAFDMIEQRVRNLVLRRVRSESLRLIVVGHSQGGALATLYGAHLAKLRPRIPVTVVTTGAPRVASPEWKASAESLPNLSIHRVVFMRDVVPRNPPRNLDYRHVGHLLLYYDDRFKAYFRQEGDDDTYAGVPDDDWNIGLNIGQQLEDHAEINYRQSIDTAITYPSIWPSDFVAKPPPGPEEDCCQRALFFCFCRRCC